MTSIYIISESELGPVKIGFSNAPERRLKQLQTGYPKPLTLHHVEYVGETNVRLMEGFIHAANRHRKVQGEWYNLTVEDAIVEVKHAMIRYDGESNEMRSRRKF